MILILDGYNVLKFMLRKDFVNEKDRAQFIAQLVDYAKFKKHTIIVVFDGGAVDRPTYEKKGIVSVLYAGYLSTADDVIKELSQSIPYSQLVLVSTDRELRSFANRHSIAAIDAATFSQFIRERKEPALKLVKSAEAAHKTQKEGNPELDILMQEGTSYVLYKDESTTQKTEKQNLSKAERERIKLKKKL